MPRLDQTAVSFSAYAAGMIRFSTRPTTLALALLAASAQAATVNAALADQPQAFVSQTAVSSRLAKLLGPVNHRFFRKNFQVVSTLQADRRVIAVTGCQRYNCPTHGSLVTYDRSNDAFKVWLTVGGKTTTFTEKGWNAARFFNADVKALLNNR